MPIKKLILLLICLLALTVVAGCAGGVDPMSSEKMNSFKEELQKIDRTSTADVKRAKDELAGQLQKDEKADKELVNFKIAYCAERLENYAEAISKYGAIKGTYQPMASFRIGEIASFAPGIMEADKTALNGYSNASGFYPDPNNQILVRNPALASAGGKADWRLENLRETANKRADPFRKKFIPNAGLLADLSVAGYWVIDFLVGLLGRNPAYSYGLAILLIALIVKVITTPLTVRQFKSMREMQAIQPLLSELQKKHKGDKEAMMREQMKLFKEHKINPLGGCLPLLVQMPFLIWVFYAIRNYSAQFEGTHFLWMKSLAMPDQILLILYAVSLYFSQKLTTMPSADPQQQQMQRMMSLMMPVMLLLILKNASAAFILYWLAQNVLMTAHQYYIMKSSPHPVIALPQETQTIKRK